MAGLISMWNSNSMGCDVVTMLFVEVVMCWGFMVLVWLCLCCNVLKIWLCLWRVLWEGCCGSCVVLISVGLRCWWVWEAWGAEVDGGWCVVFVRILWVAWDGMWYGRWAVVWSVSKGEDEGELCLNGWWLFDGVDLCVCCDVWWVFRWYGGGRWDLVWVEEWFWEVGRIYWVPVVLRVGWVHCVTVVLRIGGLCYVVVKVSVFVAV